MKAGPGLRLDILRTVQRTFAGHIGLLPARGAERRHRYILFSCFVAFAACGMARSSSAALTAAALRRLARELETTTAADVEARLELDALWEAA